MKTLVGVTFGFLLNVPALAGDVYQWRDEQGQLHFGDRPPAAAQAIPLILSPAGEGDATNGSGLRPGERARLRAIEQRERREAAEKQVLDTRAEAEERHRVRQRKQEAKRCADYRRKISDYKRRLRAGCRVSTCNSYEAQIDSYQSRAAQLCR
jgi:hypothetical protein